MSTFVVTNNNDSGLGSLRDAITQANNNPNTSTITFSVTGDIFLTSELELQANTIIIGPGANLLNITTLQLTFRIFNIINSVVISIFGLKISNGFTNDRGGAINNNANGTLIINKCQFDSNISNFIFSNGGGAIYSNGRLLVFNSTFTKNQAIIGAAINLTNSNLDNFLINCTLFENIATSINTSTIYLNNSRCFLINCTVYPDTTSTAIEVTNNSTLILGNTVVGNNSQSIPNFIVILPSIIVSLGNNFISNADGVTMFMQPTDQYGSTGASLDPKLNTLANNGGPTMTNLPKPDSPLINAGNNNLVTTFFNAFSTELVDQGQFIDQRGFYRIIGPNVDIGAVEYGSTFICYSGESMVLTKNIITSEIAEIPAKYVFSKIHQVFDTRELKFVPVIYNVVTGPISRLVEIKKDSLGKNKPNNDLYITSGHRLLIDGKEIKARKINGARRIKKIEDKIYSIYTQNRSSISINGLEVMADSAQYFLDYAKKNNLIWSDNIDM